MTANPFFRYLSRLFRSIRRRKVYSAVNIAGLAVGLACALLILLWVQYERSFDGFHAHKNEIYRLINRSQRSGVERDLSGAPPLLGPALKANFPEVVEATRVLAYQPFCSTDGPNAVQVGIRAVQVDPSFFRMFDFPFLQGQPRTALDDPYSVVLNEKTALALFGDADPIGRTVVLSEGKAALKVSGVLKNIPEISHLQFDAALPLDAYRSAKPDPLFNDWQVFFMTTYVRLDPRADASALDAKLTAFVRSQEGPAAKHQLWLQPLGRIHLDSRIYSDDENAGAADARSIALFTLIAFLVLIIACINFMNLTTAQALARAKEIGVRKVSGASKRDLVRQLLAETLGIFSLAMVLGLGLLQLLLPLLRSLTGRKLDLAVLGQAQILGTVAGITVAAALAAGILPALFLASFQPAGILKGRLSSRGGSLLGLRRALLGVQFVAAAFLIGTTGTVFHQLRFLETKDLGFARSHIIELAYAPGLEGRQQAWAGDLLSCPGVLGATNSQVTYNAGVSYKKYPVDWEGKADADPVRFYVFNADAGFVDTYGVKLKAGRFFDRTAAGETGSVLINETAARTMGLADPVGKRMTLFKQSWTVIGVLADFNATSLRTAIDPTIFLPNRAMAGLGDYPALTVRLDPADVAGALRRVESVWRRYCPGTPFRYEFIDGILRRAFYAGDEVFGRMMSGFAALAAFVAGLGLFGLIAHAAERKTREIGIRKILGASRAQILGLMSKDVAPVIVLANAAAWPLILAFTGPWLREFAYRAGYAWWLVGLTALATGLIGLATIAYHGLNAARKNPAVCLRYE